MTPLDIPGTLAISGLFPWLAQLAPAPPAQPRPLSLAPSAHAAPGVPKAA